jgi:hypothetical protein
MAEGHDLAPVIDEAIFQVVEPSDAPVNVPLVLVRHVAEPPLKQAVSLETANRLKDAIEALREGRRASLLWSPTSAWRGPSPGSVEYYFEEEAIQVYAKSSYGGRTGLRTILLDANGALLFQGTVNAFLHFLNPIVAERARQAPYFNEGVLRPEIINKHLIRLTRWARSKVDEGERRITLFRTTVLDRYGQQGHLEAAWIVDPPHISWSWTSEDRSVKSHLNVEQATWVNGFVTLLRLTYPDRWAWHPDPEGGQQT